MTLVLTIKPKRGEFGVRPEAVDAAVAWAHASQFRSALGYRNVLGAIIFVRLYDHEPEYRAHMQNRNTLDLWSMPAVGRA